MAGADPWAETRAQLTAAWDVRGIDVATLVREGGAKHVTHRRPVAGSPTTATLPPLLDARGSVPPSFTLGRTLGEGGMGVVKAARQVFLDREVAIKCLHDDAGPRAAAQLLREARIVGALEHPNIVPVHALGADAEGRPILVMKRIDGVGWDEALAKASRTPDSEAFLRKHLAILQQVARAAHFAHQRGIVHRDIKPANVMLGTHDDVYLVDWGVAVSQEGGGVRDVPLARDVRAIEGTPAYMAPEMAAADGERIGPRTDVYLLGATLYEVLSGVPPHDGETLVDVLTRAFGSDSRHYADWVPEHLRAICDRAMARLPEDRFGSAQELVDAIGVVLEHRASVILTEEASSRLEELAAASRDLAAFGPEGQHQVHTLFAECRFAFSHALATWPDNEAARRGLTRAVELMVEIELARDAPEAAALLLRDLPSPAPALEKAVREAAKRRRQQGARLERLVRDADAHIGARQRGVIALVLGGVWTSAFVALGQLDRHDWLEVRHLHVMLVVTLGMVVAGAGTYRVRDTLVNRLSRAQAISILLLQIAHLVAVGTGWALGLPLASTSALMAIVGGVAFTTGTFLVDRAYLPMVVATAAGLAIMLVWPSVHLEVLGFGGGLGAVLSARNLFRAPEPALDGAG